MTDNIYKRIEGVTDDVIFKPPSQGIHPLFILFFAIIILGTAGFILYTFYLEKSINQKDSTPITTNNNHLVPATPSSPEKEELATIVERVGMLVKLPEGEEPTIAEVTDVSELQDQDFFKDAQNGDKVLIYEKAKQAILYRPSTNKVIGIAPVNLNQKP